MVKFKLKNALTEQPCAYKKCVCIILYGVNVITIVMVIGDDLKGHINSSARVTTGRTTMEYE